MEVSNWTSVTFFVLNGISDRPELQAPIFLLVLLIYLISLGGNMTIFLLVCLDFHLHTPMYFFLCNLSIIDMSSVTVTLHSSLVSFISGDKRVYFLGCMTQMFMFSSLTGVELFILSAMSYDRYVAICKPLNYPIIMNQRVCALLAMVCWILGFLYVIPHVYVISGFTCYKSNEVNHFFCDSIPLMKLTCSDTFVLELYILFVAFVHVGVIPSLLTIISYIFIITTILRMRSNSGRRKAFYTCSSHLTVVILLYVTLFYQYLKPSFSDSLNSKKVLSLFNTAAVPILNPLIYSLKNRDVKAAWRQGFRSMKNMIYNLSAEFYLLLFFKKQKQQN